MIHDSSRKASRFTAFKAASGAALLAIAIAVSGCATPATDASSSVASASQSKPVITGQKIVMATHSFNVFVGPTRSRDAAIASTPGPLAALAAERGKAGHETLAVQMIGGSTPMQHWNQGDGDDARNIAKAALLAGGDKVDVFTMSPNAKMPEDGIDKFGDFVIAHNKNARVMVQSSWSAYDGHGSTPSVGGAGGGDFKNDDRDKETLANVEKWLASEKAPEGYLSRLRGQLDGIDKRAGKQITYVVPSSTAVYNLRREVIEGHVPGVAKQSEMHRDPIGHPTTVTAHLVTYVWYTAMYRESPVGLQALIEKDDPNSAKREKMLQQIAWNAVVGEPKSGVKGSPVKVGS
ncbi:MAG: hypothetical protein Q8R02_18605 [Hyphomonadaceae bacterium]|nr:hypothetical protein [Hyphomonadaceae bacterium]